jgi:hypothetical protein
MQTMYYIGLDVHKKKISYCVKDGSGHIHAEGAIPAARRCEFYKGTIRGGLRIGQSSRTEAADASVQPI